MRTDQQCDHKIQLSWSKFVKTVENAVPASSQNAGSEAQRGLRGRRCTLFYWRKANWSVLSRSPWQSPPNYAYLFTHRLFTFTTVLIPYFIYLKITIFNFINIHINVQFFSCTPMACTLTLGRTELTKCCSRYVPQTGCINITWDPVSGTRSGHQPTPTESDSLGLG